MTSLIRPATRLFPLLVAVWIWGCHSNTIIVPVPPLPNGLTVSLTDSPGDFATYQVDVTSLTVTDDNGKVLQLLPATLRVDFARYADTVEFVSTVAVPKGKFDSAVMTLDYSKADIRAYDSSGAVVPLTTIQDGDGNPVTTVSVPVMLGGGITDFSTAKGAAAGLTVDFNLAASNAVSTQPPLLTVRPVVAGDLAPEGDKVNRLRGMITAVGSDGFTVDLRPFAAALGTDGQSFGAFTVDVSAATVYDVDWQAYQGSGGLAQLAALQLPAPVTVQGTLDVSDGHIAATDVLAGAGMAPGNRDVLQGTVAQRQGNTLRLRGAVLTPPGAQPEFIDGATLLIDAATAVTRQFDATAHSADDISVGQRIRAVGVVTNPDLSALTVDATNGSGWVRMDLTTLSGSVQVRGAGDQDPFTFAVQNIQGRPASPAFYDFTGTGADPQNYQVQPPAVQPSEPTYKVIALGDPVILRGFVAPFTKAAGTPDFDAAVVLDVPLQSVWAVVSWPSPTTGDVARAGTQAFTVDLTGTGAFHYLYRGEAVTDLDQPGKTLTLVPPPTVNEFGFYLIYSTHGPQAYNTFDRLVTVITKQYPRTPVRHIAVRGVYNAITGTIIADMIVLYVDD